MPGECMLFSEFCDKEVINIKDCRKLGHVADIEFDPCNGCICKIIVKSRFSLCNILCDTGGLMISFCDIKQIGPEIILVDLR